MSDLERITSIEVTLSELTNRLAALEKTLQDIKASKPGRKGRPLLTSEVGVCGLDPTRDSAQCQDSTIYRYQQGCRGTACVEINRNYYNDYRAKQRAALSEEEKVENGS